MMQRLLSFVDLMLEFFTMGVYGLDRYEDVEE